MDKLSNCLKHFRGFVEFVNVKKNTKHGTYFCLLVTNASNQLDTRYTV